jgi:HSP20 family protein
MMNLAKNSSSCAYVPITDIYETKNEYVLKMEMPGLTKEELDITLDNDQLEVKGQVVNNTPEGKEKAHGEYAVGEYYRKFKLGNDIDRESVNASLENGVLVLKLQKHEKAKPKKIDIQVN